MPKENFYRGLKIVGFVSFIPFILAAGPLSGFWVGEFIRQRFNLPGYVVFLGMGIGFFVAVSEIIKIIKAVIKVSKQ